MREDVKLTMYHRAIEGFTFTWEDDCDRWENRFGIFHHLAIDPDLHGERVRHLIQTDGLMRRGYAVRVEDDNPERVPDLDRQTRLLRRLGLEEKNFKGRDQRCHINYDQQVYWHKFFLNPNQSPPPAPGSPGSPFSPFSPASPASPAISPSSPAGSPLGSPMGPDNILVLNTSVVELDSPEMIDPANKVVHIFRVMDMDQPGIYSELKVTFTGGSSVEYEWVGCGPTQTVNMIPVPDNPSIDFEKSSMDFMINFPHPSIPGIEIILQFTAFETPENVDYLFAVDPTYNNMTFRTMTDTSPVSAPFWYVFATVMTDPYKHPIQWLGVFDSVWTNFQDISCCTVLGTVAPNGYLDIDEELEESYRYPIYHGIELLAIEDATGDIVDRLVWNGSYWETVLKRSELAWNMLPTGNGGDTWGSSPATSPAMGSPYEAANVNNVRVIGDVGLIAGSPMASPLTSPADPCLQRSGYTIKLCAIKAGDKLLYRLKAQIADFWSLGRLHRGEYSPWDKEHLWYGAFRAGDLIDLKHNKWIDAAAMDDFYFRSTPEGVSPATAQMHPAFRYTLTPPTPIDQMQWDSGDYWDGLPHQWPMPYEAAKLWDAGSLDPRYIHISHFPNKTVWSVASIFNIALVSPAVPGTPPPPVFSLTAPVNHLEGGEDETTIVTCTVAFEGSETPSTVDFETFDIGEAVPGEDYVHISGTLVFAPGEYLKTFEVEVIGDVFLEPDEGFGVRILNPVDGQLIPGNDEATIDILNGGDTVVPPPIQELIQQGDPDETLVGLAGGIGWSGPWEWISGPVNGENTGAIIKPGLVYPDPTFYNPGNRSVFLENVETSSSADIFQYRRPLTPGFQAWDPDGDAVYMSFLYRHDQGTNNFRLTLNTAEGKHFYVQGEFNGSNVRLRLRTEGIGGNPNVQIGSGTTPDTNHLIIVKVERTSVNSNQRLNLYMARNPANLLVESWNVTGGSNNGFPSGYPTAKLNFTEMLLRFTEAGSRVQWIDAIRVGKTWQDVVPTV